MTHARAASQWSREHDMVVRRFGSGREIVWIHGLGEQSASFDPIAQRIDAAHVLVDLPGYGRSPWPGAPPSIDDVADQLAQWIGDRKPILAGHSLGGVFAQLVAERIEVGGVIDIDGNLSRGDCTYSARAIEYTADDFAAHGFDVIRDEIYKRGIADPAMRGYYVAMRMASPHVFHRHARELVALSEGETLAPRLAALRCPVTFIGGYPNGICERGRQLLEQHGVHRTLIDDSGHWPFIDQPAAFAEAVTRYLASLPAVR